MRRREFITLESRTRSNGARISQSSHETLALKWAPAAVVCGKGEPKPHTTRSLDPARIGGPLRNSLAPYSLCTRPAEVGAS
jgi:hypothetical protein